MVSRRPDPPRPHVPVEHALSGPGLMNLHAALCAVRGVDNRYSSPGGITGPQLTLKKCVMSVSMSCIVRFFGGGVVSG